MKSFIISIFSCMLCFLLFGLTAGLIYQNAIIKRQSEKEYSLANSLEKVKSENSTLANANINLKQDLEAGLEICTDQANINKQEVAILGNCLAKLSELLVATANEDQVSMLLSLNSLHGPCEEAASIINKYENKNQPDNSSQIIN